MRPIQWHLKNSWRVPESLEKVIPVPRSLHPHFKMVAGGKQCSTRSTITPSKTCSADLYRRIKKEGWGAHLNELTARGTWSLPESKLHINHLELKSVFLALKEFKDLVSNNIVLVDTDNTTVVAYINKEGDEVGPSVWPSVENPDLVHQERGNSQSSTHPRPAECDSRQAIQARSDHPDRVVSSSRDVPGHMFPMAPAPGGPVCHQVQQQTGWATSVDFRVTG